MSTDTKAPPAPPPEAGNADILDAIVQEHLERAAEPPPPRQQATPCQPAPLLQQEIEMLLRDGPDGASADPSPQQLDAAILAQSSLQDAVAQASAIEAHLPTPNASTPLEEPTSATPAPAVSQAERDILLPPATPAAALAPMAHDLDDTEQKLTEAEGVLAEELSKLMADAEGTAQLAADATAPLTPGIAENTPITPAPTAAPTAAAAEAPTAPTPAPAPAEAPAAAPTAATPTVIETSTAEATPSETPTAPTGLITRLRHTTSDLFLMFAQLVDWPFAWMEDLYKNVIGVAAFMLALGGLVLWLLARWTG